MDNPTPPSNRLMGLIDGLLDKGYDRATAATLRAIAGSTQSGIVAQRLNELDAEVARLVESGQRLNPDNPVLRALLADLEPVLRRDAVRIDGVAQDVQVSGTDAAGKLTRELALGGMNDAQLMRLGVQWNTPDPEVVARTVGYVQSEGFAGEIAKYPQLILETVQNQAVRGIVEGWNPTRTAREIRRMTENLPAHQANTIMRTLQLTSYRDGNAIHQLANADILQEQIRIAALDARTCMACVALHGTRLAVGERVDDHHNGRCTSIAVVKGVTRNVATGEQWFNSLPDDQQQKMMGIATWTAWKSNAIEIKDFVQTYEDPTYGRMVRQASAQHLLKDSKQFWSNAAKAGAIAPSPSRPSRQSKSVGSNFLSSDALYKYIQDAGLDLEQVEDAIADYTGYAYEHIRAAQRGDYDAVASSGLPLFNNRNAFERWRDTGNIIDEFLLIAPPYDGAVMRGIVLRDGEGSPIKTKLGEVIRERYPIGHIFSEDAITSYTRERESPDEIGFIRTSNLIFKVNENKSGVGIRSLSNYPNEDEVLMPSAAQWRVRGIIDRNTLPPDDAYYVNIQDSRYIIEIEEVE